MKKLLIIIFTCLAAVCIAQKQNLVVEGAAPNLYIQHKVTAGESLYSLARKFNQSPQTIAAFNGLSLEKGLLIGQTIKVPLTAQNLALPGETLTSETSIPLYHVAGKSETLFRISNNMGASLPEVKQWNNLSSDKIAAGTPLIVGHIKMSGAVAAKSKSETPATSDLTAKNDINNIPDKPAVESKNESPAATATNVEANKQEPSAATIVEQKKPEPIVTNTKAEEQKQATVPQKVEALPATEPIQKTEPTLIDKPQQTAPLKEEPKKLDLLAPEPEMSNEGVFSALYSSDVAQKSLTNKMGEASTFKSTSGWQDKKYYVLMNDVPAGTILKIATVDNDSKFIFAKVLGNMPEMKENKGLLLRISNAAASYLGMVDSKFPVQVTFYQ